MSLVNKGKQKKVSRREQRELDLLEFVRTKTADLEQQLADANSVEDPSEKVLKLQDAENTIRDARTIVDKTVLNVAWKQIRWRTLGAMASLKVDKQVEEGARLQKYPELVVLQDMQTRASGALDNAVRNPPLSKLKESSFFEDAFSKCKRLNDRFTAAAIGKAAVERDNETPVSSRTVRSFGTTI